MPCGDVEELTHLNDLEIRAFKLIDRNSRDLMFMLQHVTLAQYLSAAIYWIQLAWEGITYQK